MRQDLEEEFQRRTDNDKIRLFDRKCSGEFLIWDCSGDLKPPEELKLRVFKFKHLSATFHQRRVTANGSDKIEQFPFSEDGTDQSELQIGHNTLPGLVVPFRKISWTDRGKELKRHLNPKAESIETTFKLSEANDGVAAKRRTEMANTITMSQEILERHTHRNNPN